MKEADLSAAKELAISARCIRKADLHLIRIGYALTRQQTLCFSRPKWSAFKMPTSGEVTLKLRAQCRALPFHSLHNRSGMSHHSSE